MSSDDSVVVNAKGLACPEPVMVAKSALGKSGGKPVEVSVDTATARDNVLRMAKREGREAEARADGDGFIVLIHAKKA